MQSVNILSSVITVRRLPNAGEAAEGDEGSSLCFLQQSLLPITLRVPPTTGGGTDVGTRNIDGLHFEMTDAFLKSNSCPPFPMSSFLPTLS